jgi:hypothetical protein
MASTAAFSKPARPTSEAKVTMLNLELSAAEQAVLREVLETAVSELGTEISATDAKEYRDDLKARREVLQRVIATLGGEAGS